MEIYNLYQSVLSTLALTKGAINIPQDFYVGLTIASSIWLALFILQGVGVYRMAKNRGMEGAWKAFVPFVNVLLLGKLAGSCNVFGQRVKRVELFTMIAQIIAFVLCACTLFSEIYLYSVCGVPNYTELQTPYWTGLQGFSLAVYRFYDISPYIQSIVQLAYEILLLILLIGLYKSYAPKNYMILGFLCLFVPLARYIVIFVLRNKKAIDYDAYMRARHEAYMRSRSPYGNPYHTPYGNPYGNPYGAPQSNQPTGKAPDAPEDPFAEFGSEKSSEKGNSAENTDGNSDEFFS